jgi:hypothetical protein
LKIEIFKVRGNTTGYLNRCVNSTRNIEKWYSKTPVAPRGGVGKGEDTLDLGVEIEK